MDEQTRIRDPCEIENKMETQSDNFITGKFEFMCYFIGTDGEEGEFDLHWNGVKSKNIIQRILRRDGN